MFRFMYQMPLYLVLERLSQAMEGGDASGRSRYFADLRLMKLRARFTGAPIAVA